MQPIRRIADLPFRERPGLELLNLHTDRDAPDPDYTGFGHARFEAIWLERPDGSLERVERALVLALHCTDSGGEALSDDVELEFFIDEVHAGYSVTVLLSAFLAEWLPRLHRDEDTVVLALCNRRRVTIARPAGLGSTRLAYALGDVESWLDADTGRVQLLAETWRIAQAPQEDDAP